MELGPMSGAGTDGSKSGHKLTEGNSGGLGSALNSDNSMVGQHKLQHANVGSLVKSGNSTTSKQSGGKGRKGD